MWCYLRPHWVCYLMSGIYLYYLSKIQTILNSKTYMVTKFVGKVWWVCGLLGHDLGLGYQTVLPNAPQSKEKKEGGMETGYTTNSVWYSLIILLSPHFHISSLGSMLLSASNLPNSVAASSYKLLMPTFLYSLLVLPFLFSYLHLSDDYWSWSLESWITNSRPTIPSN